MMIKNLWKNVKIYCGRHEELVELVPNEKGSTLFYSCPKYYSMNREPNEKACANRISMMDYQMIVEHLGDVISMAEQNQEMINLTGHRWKKKNIRCEVVDHENGEYKVKVINTKSL